jgi:hypothetical protein
LLIAGFFVFAKQTAHVVLAAYRDPQQKITAVVCSGLLVCLAGYLVVNNAVLAASVSPASTGMEAMMTRDMSACAARVEAELPPDARLLSDNDPLLYLQTGRQSMRLVVPSKHFYRDGSEGMMREALRVSEVANQHGLRYYLMHRSYDRDIGDQLSAFNAAVDRDPNLRILFQCGQASVYEIVPSPGLNAKTVLP